MTDNQKIYLTISKNYVSSWGVWEGVREFLQNANDTEKSEVSYGEESINITSFDSEIDKKYLILGNTTKADKKNLNGKYGEGFKLAILVLLREGKDVVIYNGNDVWYPSFENHPEINDECLTITIEKNVYTDKKDVTVVVNGLNKEEIEIIQKNSLYGQNINIEAEYNGSTCWHSNGKPKVFVGGLYVCDLNEKYLMSYNFHPSVMDLDRDRKSVSTFSVSYEATKIITLAGNYNLLSYLAEESAEDISDYYSFKEPNYYYGGTHKSEVNSSEKLKEIVSEGFISKHGEKAFPINSGWDEKKKRINTVKSIQAGYIPVVIKSGYYEMLQETVKSKELSPFDFNISDEILKFFEANKKLLRSKPKQELEKIVNMIKMIDGDYLPPEMKEKIVVDNYDKKHTFEDDVPF